MISILYHPSAAKHRTPKGHPECAERISSIRQHLQGSDIAAQLSWQKGNLVNLNWYHYAHPQSYIDQIQRRLSHIADDDIHSMDSDTYASQGTLQALQAAAGLHQYAIDSLAQQPHHVYCCLHRPPGHHAETTTAMGFCYFNHVANSALYALASKQFKRPAVLDFDVHHGNGSEDILCRQQPQHPCFFASTFESFNYPTNSQAINQPKHLQIALTNGFNSNEFRQAWLNIFTQLETFNADLLILSAGFDAHAKDPLSAANLDEQDYHWLGKHFKSYHLPLLISLEGGYNLHALTTSFEALLRGVLEEALIKSANAHHPVRLRLPPLQRRGIVQIRSQNCVDKSWK